MLFCEACEKEFGNKEALKQHVKQHVKVGMVFNSTHFVTRL